LPVWTYSTEAGGVIWFQSKEGEVANVQSPEVNISGNNNYVPCPPSINTASGLLYDWEFMGADKLVPLSLAAFEDLPLQLLKTASPISESTRQRQNRSEQLGLAGDPRSHSLSHATWEYIEARLLHHQPLSDDRLFAA